jgi:hypothetical protein
MELSLLICIPLDSMSLASILRIPAFKTLRVIIATFT